MNLLYSCFIPLISLFIARNGFIFYLLAHTFGFMIAHIDIGGNLMKMVRSGEIALGGYKHKKIYGTLHCSAGKRMKTENRVFFKDEKEAVSYGYRPCAHCMPEKYKHWKNAQFTA